MNKKIKVIELWNIIAQVEDIEKLPKKIKYDEEIYELQTLSRDYYYKREDDYLTDRVNDKPFNIFLNDEVEILEDNTEDLEELDTDIHIDSFMDAELNFNKIAQEINKLGKAIKEIRKDLNKWIVRIVQNNNKRCEKFKNWIQTKNYGVPRREEDVHAKNIKETETKSTY